MSTMFSAIKQRFLRFFSLAIIVLPSWLKISIYRRIYGYKIGRHVNIGLSWILVGELEIADHVTIGHFCRFKNVPRVLIGEFAYIANGNTFTSTAEFTSADGRRRRGNCPELIIGRHCGISLFHYFDVQDRFTIGAFTTIGGIGSVFFTHYIDFMTSTESTKAIHIGDYCMLGSSVRFIPGARVANGCVVGMGAVVTRSFEEEYCFIGGNPAKVIRSLSPDAAYFTRTTGYI